MTNNELEEYDNDTFTRIFRLMRFLKKKKDPRLETLEEISKQAKEEKRRAIEKDYEDPLIRQIAMSNLSSLSRAGYIEIFKFIEANVQNGYMDLYAKLQRERPHTFW